MRPVQLHRLIERTALVAGVLAVIAGCNQRGTLVDRGQNPVAITSPIPDDLRLCPTPPVTPDPGPWVVYVDDSTGIRFKYPANWEVSRRMGDDAIYVTNVSNCLKGHEYDITVIRIDGRWRSMAPFVTLADYLDSESERMTEEQLISQEEVVMPPGYEAIRRLWWGEGKNSTIYLAHSGLVISANTSADTRYTELAERVAKTIE